VLYQPIETELGKKKSKEARVSYRMILATPAAKVVQVPWGCLFAPPVAWRPPFVFLDKSMSRVSSPT